MATVLKVDEWKGGSGNWYVADVHTWTSWRECADILGLPDLDSYVDYLKTKYHAIVDKIVEYTDKPTLVIFHWDNADYKNAHQFKLDVNRIARKKNYLVERSF